MITAEVSSPRKRGTKYSGIGIGFPTEFILSLVEGRE